jgi:hypothetical protein
MKSSPTIAAREPNAAASLDLPVTKFRQLVHLGALPKPVTLADGTELWLLEDLIAILKGKTALPDQEFEL